MPARIALARLIPLAFAAACAAPAKAPPPASEPPPPPPPPPPYTFPHPVVWSARERIVLVGDSAAHLIRRPFTALEVVDADPETLRVRCALCPGAPEGRVPHADVVYEPKSPADAERSTLAEFALAVRTAAAAADTAALREVMAPSFTVALFGRQGIEQALSGWRSQDLRPLRAVPALLDRGLVSRDSLLWVAPPEFLEEHAYAGPRVGFRRDRNGRWEWLFLVRGERSSGP